MITAFFKSTMRQKKATLGLLILLTILILSFTSPLWTKSPLALLGQPHQEPSLSFWLGTNGQGQDVLAQCFRGAVSSLSTAFLVGLVVTFMGAFLGIGGAFYGGWVDKILTLMINLFLLIPGLPLAILMAAYLPSGPFTIAFVLIFTGWAWNARVIRSQALALRKTDFIAASLVAGDRGLRIIVCEMLPNMSSLIVSIFIGSTIYAIGAQVGLEFLGLGDVSQVSWGTILYWAANDSALLTGSWWMYVPAGLLIALVGFSLAMINFGMDEVGNPRLKDKDFFTRALKQKGMTYQNITPVVNR